MIVSFEGEIWHSEDLDKLASGLVFEMVFDELTGATSAGAVSRRRDRQIPVPTVHVELQKLANKQLGPAGGIP